MTAPHKYVLGGNVEIDITTTDQNGDDFIPVLVRLSVKEPSGNIITYSGVDLTTASGFLFTLYKPPTRGWYQYETWVKDGTGREDTDTWGFDVYDEVY